MDLSQALKQMSANVKEVKRDLTSAYQHTLMGIGDSLIFYTPLKTGLASSNWNVGTGPISTERQPVEGTKGRASSDAIRVQSKAFNTSMDAVFSNPVDYIDDLERGTSRQAPAGMVTPTIIRVEDIWLNCLRSFKLI